MKKSICFILIFISLSCFSKTNNERKELVEMFLNNVFDTLCVECNNEKAIVIYLNKLDTIKLVVERKDSFYFQPEISDIIMQFELLTKIESESDGNFLGKFDPTENDIIKWQKWLNEHKEQICWYEEKEILFLRKKE